MKIAIDIKSALGEKTGKGVYCYNITKELAACQNVEIIQISATGIMRHLKVFLDVLRRHKKNELDIYFSPGSFIVTALLHFVKILTLGFVKTPKFYVTVHDLVAFLYSDTHDKKAVLIERLTLAPTLKGAEKIFAVSENTKNDIVAKFHTPSEKIVVTYNAVGEDFRRPDQNALDDFQKKHSLPERYILSLGTLVPRKNLSLTLQAFEKLCNDAEFTKGIDLVIVGGKGWGHGSRRRLARRNKARSNHDMALEAAKKNPRIHFLGYLPYEELPYIYAGAEIFVYPSLYEGFGIPPLEAQAMGCPVITSNTSSLPEVVSDSAIQIDPYDPDELVNAVKSILTDSQLRGKLIKAGYENIKRFSWKESAKIILGNFS